MDPEYRATLLGRRLDRAARRRFQKAVPGEPDDAQRRRLRRLERLQTDIRFADHATLRQTREFLNLSWPEFWHYAVLVISRHIQESEPLDE